uniref:TetR family transcriptional regulator n=1 Tax=Hormoscilla spongeliae GUM096 TaxID=1962682 RepID=A0A1S6M1M3_9CYAN|nr:TetR family transcriptional regulator [Hormoscilla spongeliae GUM096]
MPCDLPQNGIFAEKFTKNGCLGRKNFYRWQLEFYTKLYSMVLSTISKRKMDKPQPGDLQQPSAKAEAIVAAAMREFLAHSYAATSMDRVAKAAGVSKATVYSYFENKEELFSTSIERFAKEKYAAVFNPTGDRPWEGEPRVVLRRIVSNFLEMAAGDPQL